MGYRISFIELLPINAIVEQCLRTKLRASPFLASTQTQRAVIGMFMVGARAMDISVLTLA